MTAPPRSGINNTDFMLVTVQPLKSTIHRFVSFPLIESSINLPAKNKGYEKNI
jgi:hypothetical protein